MRISFLEFTKTISFLRKKNLSGVSVLLVEDDVALSRMYVKSLKNAGATVSVAYDGVVGLEMLHNDTPDIIVLDLMMPRMNGYDMLKKARENRMIGDVPVIILTNLKDRPEDIVKIQKFGVNDYLIKSDTHLNKLLYKIEKHATRTRKV